MQKFGQPPEEAIRLFVTGNMPTSLQNDLPGVRDPRDHFVGGPQQFRMVKRSDNDQRWAIDLFQPCHCRRIQWINCLCFLQKERVLHYRNAIHLQRFFA